MINQNIEYKDNIKKISKATWVLELAIKLRKYLITNDIDLKEIKDLVDLQCLKAEKGKIQLEHGVSLERKLDTTKEQATWILGWTIAETLLLSPKNNAKKYISLLFGTHSWHGSEDCFSYYLNDHEENFSFTSLQLKHQTAIDLQKKLIEVIEYILAPLQKAPELMAHRIDEYNTYWHDTVKEWNDATEVSSFWSSPLRHHNIFGSLDICLLSFLLPWNVKHFIELCDTFRIPTQLDNIKWNNVIQRNDNLLLEIIGRAPVILNAKKEWNKSILVLEFIEAAIDYLEYLFKNSRIDQAKLFAERLVNTISNRIEDGNFIINAFRNEYLIKSLNGAYKKDDKVKAQNAFVNKLIEFTQKNSDYFSLNNIASNADYKDFFEKGYVSSQVSPISLQDFITNSFLGTLPPKDALELLHTVIAHEDKELYTSEHSVVLPSDLQFIIGKIYQDDIINSWKSTWTFMSSARFRLGMHQYGKICLDIRYRINFVLCCGIAAYSICSKREECTDCKNFGGILWEAIFDCFLIDNGFQHVFYERVFSMWFIITLRLCTQYYDESDDCGRYIFLKLQELNSATKIQQTINNELREHSRLGDSYKKLVKNNIQLKDLITTLEV